MEDLNHKRIKLEHIDSACGRKYSEDQLLQELAEWVVDEGGYVSERLELYRDDTYGCGIRIKPGSKTAAISSDYIRLKPLLECPSSSIFSLANPKPNLPILFLHSHSLSVHAKACFHLSQHLLQQERSRFWPYLRLLPREFDTPLYFSEDELERLAGTNLGAGDVELRRNTWTNEWRQGLAALKELGDLTEYTWELYLRAATIYSSRSFPSKLVGTALDSQIPHDITKSFPVLIPLIDLLNHKPNTKIIWHPSPRSFAVEIPEDLAAQAQIFNNYGPKANEELLMGYGFVIPNNPVDSLAMKFKAFPQGLAADCWQKRDARRTWTETFYLATPTLNTERENHLVALETEWPAALVDLFRILLASEYELSLLLEDSNKTPISSRNEIAVALNLRNAMAQKLATLRKFDTSSQKIAKSERMRLADTYRKGQEQIMVSKLEDLEIFINHYIKDKGYSSKQFTSDHPDLADFLNENPVPADETNQYPILEIGELMLVIAIIYEYFPRVDQTTLASEGWWDKFARRIDEDYGMSYQEWSKSKNSADELSDDSDISELQALVEYCSSIPGTQLDSLTNDRLSWAWSIVRICGIEIEDDELVLML